MAFSSSVSKVDRSIPAFAKASSVGANTVKGPSPDSVVTRSACVKAATRESCMPVAEAFVGMSSVSDAETLTGIADRSKMAISKLTILEFMSHRL